MAGNVGRGTKVKKNAVTLIGVRTATLDWSGEPIDLSSGEDDGFRLLGSLPGQKQIDLSIEGVTKDSVLKDLALTGGSTLLTDITIEFAIINPANTTAATLSGDFYMASFSDANPYNDAITFTAPMQSSGEWTYTPEAA